MWGDLLQLIIMLLVILLAAQLFTNALEHFSQKLHISAGTTGSILAAVATALPETTVPIIAIIAGGPNKVVNAEISVGAILGSSLMLSTLSTFLLGLAALHKRGWRGCIAPEITGFKRDLDFFLMAFFLAALALFVPSAPHYWRLGLGCSLIVLYVIYLICTLRASKALVQAGHGVQIHEPVLLTKIGFKNTGATIALQLLLGLVILVLGAKGFVGGVEAISLSYHISALVLALLIVPLATELPEKVNSILWIRKNKDTLGFSNITGAMVFQGTLLPALGIILTPWQPNNNVLAAMGIAFLAAFWLRVNAATSGLRILALSVNGLLYGLFLFCVFF